MGKTYTVRCKSLNEKGEGVATFNNSKFEVPYALPGEKCDIELVYKGNGSRAEAKAKLVNVIEPSKDRVEAGCPLYGKCGACNLLHMNYDAELKFKQEKVAALLNRFGGEQLPIITSEKPEHYRNKVYAAFDFVVSKGHSKIVAGMYDENSHEVTGTTDCLLQHATANSIIKTIIDIMRITGTRAYDEDTKTGVLRHCYIRVSQKTGKVMLVLVTGTPDLPCKKQFIDTLTKKHHCISTIIHNVNMKKTSMVLGDRDTIIYGPGFIEDELCGVTFRISPHSFYQVNPAQTEKLYRTAIDFAELKPLDNVIDAYCGIGTISLIASEKCGSVTGVELNKEAVRDAAKNAELNKADNVTFVAGDAGEFLKQCDEKTDVVFMDPPRSGSSETFLRAVCDSEASKIVYISCNPETQVRDIEFLTKNGYKLVKWQAVDMFSKTANVETVCLLSKLHEAKHHVSVKLDMDEMDITSAESKATYEEIKKYVAEHNDGMKVSSLNIAQVKAKYGIIERENYNLPKTEDSRQPQCPKEKEDAIMEALKAFQMI